LPLTALSNRATAWRRAAALASLLIASSSSAAAEDGPVAALERGLSPAIVIAGEAPRTVPLAERMGQLGIPAVSVAYFDRGRIVWARAWGYADRERHVLATRDTLFQAGAIGERLAAVAEARLVERGQLAPDPKVQQLAGYARALSEATGTPFPELMRREVLGPLGMRNSTFEEPLPELLQARAAVGYLRDCSRAPADSRALWTTPSDLARLAIARRFDAEGAGNGFHAVIAAGRDRGTGVVILTNAEQGVVLAREIQLTLAREYGWPAPVPEVRHAVAVDAPTLRALAGRYIDGESGLAFQVMPREGVLRLVIDGSPEQELVPEAPDRFFVRQTGERLQFQNQGDTVVAVLPGGRKAMRIEP
jgi:CubicO group peptidase (beta-lactamase class C family)